MPGGVDPGRHGLSHVGLARRHVLGDGLPGEAGAADAVAGARTVRACELNNIILYIRSHRFTKKRSKQKTNENKLDNKSLLARLPNKRIIPSLFFYKKSKSTKTLNEAAFLTRVPEEVVVGHVVGVRLRGGVELGVQAERRAAVPGALCVHGRQHLLLDLRGGQHSHQEEEGN